MHLAVVTPYVGMARKQDGSSNGCTCISNYTMINQLGASFIIDIIAPSPGLETSHVITLTYVLLCADHPCCVVRHQLQRNEPHQYGLKVSCLVIQVKLMHYSQL